MATNSDGIQWNLYTIDVATHQVERLTHDQVEDKHPQYTPDGSVVFHSDRDSTHVTLQGGEEFDLMNLWSLDPRAGTLAKLTSSRGMRDNRHAWISPDGRFIAFHSNIISPVRKHQGLYEKAHRELCIITRDGRHQVNLTHRDYRNFKHPTWSADGRSLFFVFKEKGNAWNAGSMEVSEALTRLQ